VFSVERSLGALEHSLGLDLAGNLATNRTSAFHTILSFTVEQGWFICRHMIFLCSYAKISLGIRSSADNIVCGSVIEWWLRHNISVAYLSEILRVNLVLREKREGPTVSDTWITVTRVASYFPTNDPCGSVTSPLLRYIF